MPEVVPTSFPRAVAQREDAVVMFFLDLVGASPTPGSALEIAGSVAWVMFLLLLIVGVPTAISISVLKYRLYDIDIVVRKTVVVGTLVLSASVVYVVAALIVQRIATGQGTTVAFVAV